MSGGKHFEIIIGSRQLAALVALVALALLVVFALGVAVGMLEPRRRSTEAVPPAWRSASGDVTPRDSALLPAATPPAAVAPPAEATPTPEPVLPPALPADIAAATPPALPTVTAALTSAAVSETPAPRLPKPSPTPRPKLAATPLPRAWIQVAALSRPELAEGVRQRVLAEFGFRPEQVIVMPGTGGKYRVRLGPFPDQESAGRVVSRLHAKGFADAYALRE